MVDTGTPPVIPAEFQQYNSYLVDPQWQRKFSIVWASVLAFFVVLSLPHLVRSLRNGRAYSSAAGITEDLSGKSYDLANDVRGMHRVRRQSLWRKVENVLNIAGGLFWWMVPGLGLMLGEILLISGYIATVISCIVVEAPLMENSNRAGFIAIAQLPIVFLFATKNSVVSFLLGPGNGYEKLNFIHRWSGRLMFMAAILHGALWIRNHLQYDLPIIGQQKEGSGVAAVGLLGIIVLSSLPIARRWCYQLFYIIHMMGMVGFFVTLCYHTIYATPWIFPPMAFYGLDILLRMFRHRIKDAVLVPVGNQMTLIHVPYVTSGWIAGQHVRLRVFFSGRIFESHPLTIFSAPPDISCITSMPSGISLGARAVGDWTKALNNYAVKTAVDLKLIGLEEKSDVTPHHEEQTPAEVPVQVMIDGPYGGCSVDLGQYETALLFAGGSGITFTLGVLDDIVGRCVRKGRKGGERTKRIEFAWCVRSFGSIDWFAPALMDIARVAESSLSSATPLDLHVSIYVTCLCNPEAIPPIPNCDVTIVRPSVYRVLQDLTSVSSPQKAKRTSTQRKSSSAEDEDEEEKEKPCAKETLTAVDMEADFIPRVPFVAEEGGGLAVITSGPESLIREAANAVARIQMSGKGIRLGGVGLHTEIFSL
ncbi:iron reductase [Pholiota conissans]|uniref:Iron reductase n=1 Tax=Pholiota conissans TaxID=109636 RepID=A0A9P5YXW5_9AGAR|nr:iron reductase [Pholiota conissans]